MSSPTQKISPEKLISELKIFGAPYQIRTDTFFLLRETTPANWSKEAFKMVRTTGLEPVIIPPCKGGAVAAVPRSLLIIILF